MLRRYRGAAVEYKNFYLAARRYAKCKITRGEFMADWADAQRQQGIKPAQIARQCRNLKRKVGA
jgi:hypothetical protein